MLRPGDPAPPFTLRTLDDQPRPLLDERGRLRLLIFFETDCPTCHLTFSYLEKLAQLSGVADRLLAVSQDDAAATRAFLQGLRTPLPTVLDEGLRASEAYAPVAVPTLFLLDGTGRVLQTQTAFDKAELNAIAAALCESAGLAPFELAGPYDGNPDRKPGCTSRHLEPRAEGEAAPLLNLQAAGARASRIALAPGIDPIEHCLDAGFDALPVVPPTIERVERMLRETPLPPEEVVGRIPPNYGAATVEKIARGGRTVATASDKTGGGMAAPTPSRPLRVLLAEDNQINAVLATTLMRRGGHRVETTLDLALQERAVEALRSGLDRFEKRHLRRRAKDGADAPLLVRHAGGGPPKRNGRPLASRETTRPRELTQMYRSSMPFIL